jgi:transposase InsO family protein
MAASSSIAMSRPSSRTHNLIDIKTIPRLPEANGIVERINVTVRDESDNDYGNNYLQAEAIIGKLMQHYNEEQLHATLGYMTPATWQRGQPMNFEISVRGE